MDEKTNDLNLVRIEQTGVVILTGGEKSFSAGMDPKAVGRAVAGGTFSTASYPQISRSLTLAGLDMMMFAIILRYRSARQKATAARPWASTEKGGGVWPV